MCLSVVALQAPPNHSALTLSLFRMGPFRGYLDLVGGGRLVSPSAWHMPCMPSSLSGEEGSTFPFLTRRHQVGIHSEGHSLDPEGPSRAVRATGWPQRGHGLLRRWISPLAPETLIFSHGLSGF